MQLFSSLLAVAASVFVIVSAEEHNQLHSSPKGRGSRKLPNPQPIIGGDSSVWGPSISRSSRSSRCSSVSKPSCSSVSKPSCSSVSKPSCSSVSKPSCPSESSTSCWSSESESCWSPCDYGCGLPCNPLSPAVTPLNPITPCDPLYGPGYGAFPGCGPCGPSPLFGVDPLVAGAGFGLPNPFVNPCSPCASPCVNPCASPCPRPCDRKSRGSRRYANAQVAHAQPWYVYLTATLTSTYSSIATVNTFTTTDLSTVAYTIFTIASSDVPNAYYSSV